MPSGRSVGSSNTNRPAQTRAFSVMDGSLPPKPALASTRDVRGEHGRLVGASKSRGRRGPIAVRCGPPSAVEMLLAAWGAAVGHPAYVTTKVADLTGAPARSFHDWVAEHADSFGTVGGVG